MSDGHTFRPHDFVGGHVVLDLVNTVNVRNADPVDWLGEYSGLLQWAAMSGAFDDDTLTALALRCAVDRAGAASAMRAIRDLREALHDVLSTVIRGEPAPGAGAGLGYIEHAWKEAVAHARLVVADGWVRTRLDVEVSGLAYLNHDLVLRAVDLLGSLPAGRTRTCAGSRCGWLFLDRSKGGQRRWCDMATCGNQAKSVRHYRKTRT
jgi:predicted RNA-binding Zn ribbon-like protein